MPGLLSIRPMSENLSGDVWCERQIQPGYNTDHIEYNAVNFYYAQDTDS